jgi:ABC-type transport system involved in multi-copper enzyme maturation permease subunit
MSSLVKHTVQRVLGLKRSFWNKILPGLTIFLAYVPAIVFVGIATFLKSRLVTRGVDMNNVIPTYGDYYGFIWAAIAVFVAFVAPEALCTDRRTGMLGLYLASPLRRDTYLASKAAAIGFVLSIVTLGPPLFMLIARVIAGVGPNGFTGVARVLGKVVISGIIVAALPASLSLAVSSTTSRRAAASAAIVLISLGSIAVSESLIAAGASANVFVLNLVFLPLELVHRIYGRSPGETPGPGASVPTSTLVIAYLLLTFGFAAFVRYRYQRIQVTR